MIRLYLSLDLVKSEGSPPAGGGGPKGVSPPKTPGAATGGSGPQVVDCPLGAECPDGGRHQMGSAKLQEHTAQAQQAGQMGQMPGDESQGKESGKPGVPPGAANIGGVGSDQIRRPPKVREVNQVAGPLKNKPNDKRLEHRDYYVDQWQNWPYESPRPSLEEHLKQQGFKAKDIQEAHQEEGIDQFEARKQGAPSIEDVSNTGLKEAVAFAKQPDESNPRKTSPQKLGAKVVSDDEKKTGQTNMENKVVQDIGLGHKPDAPDERLTLKEFPAYAEPDSGFENPASQKKTLITPSSGANKRQAVPNPMVADEQLVPADSKPMDHYKLSQVARESGDEDLAKFHEGMARKRTEGMGSEDHRQLAEQLHADGMHEQAKYHADIHSRVGALESDKKEVTPEQEKKHHDTVIDVHSQARAKASSDLDAAKKKHEETKAKADKIRASNEEKVKAYEAAKAEHEKKKTEAKNAKDKASVPKVGKPPQKPKLDKEEKVPEKPDLYEPENDADKLRHEGHTSKAQRLADIAESHLKGNKDLTAAQRQRLERAHKMAVYHSNIGYTPTAAHKKELGEVEQAMSGMDVKQHHEEVVAAENQKKTAEAAKQAEKDRSAQEKQQAKQAKADEKAKAQQDKEQAKMEGQQPQPPQTDLDHARVADHKAQAQKLRNNIQSHMEQNPNMSPEEKARAERVLSELEKHENMDMVPGSDHQSELKELQKLAGDHGKKPFEAETGDEGSPTPRHNYGNSGGYVLPMLHSGRALGTGLAASATSPYGAAGHLGPQIVSYGVTGATTAGHRLLHDSQSAKKDEKDIQEGLDKEKEDQAKRAKAASRQNDQDVFGRGNS